MNKSIVCSNCGASFVPERKDAYKNIYCNSCIKMVILDADNNLLLIKGGVKNGKSIQNANRHMGKNKQRKL